MACIYGRIFETHTHGPYVQVVHTGHPYIRVHFSTPVHTGRTYGCQKVHRIYRPYLRIVRIGLKMHLSEQQYWIDNNVTLPNYITGVLLPMTVTTRLTKIIISFSRTLLKMVFLTYA